MAQLGRSGLLGKSNDKFPTNNEKRIKAIDHRLYNSDMIDSKFNWVDDEIPLVWWDKANNITLADYLNNNFGVLASGIITGSNIPMTDGFNMSPVGDFSSAISYSTASNNVNRIEVEGNFGTDKYIVIPSLYINSTDINSLSLIFAIGSQTANKFEIIVRETAELLQSFKIKIALLKMEV